MPQPKTRSVKQGRPDKVVALSATSSPHGLGFEAKRPKVVSPLEHRTGWRPHRRCLRDPCCPIGAPAFDFVATNMLSVALGVAPRAKGPRKNNSRPRIPSAGHLRLLLGREILKILRVFLRFHSVVAAESDPHLGAILGSYSFASPKWGTRVA
jgi:hypothetical protein